VLLTICSRQQTNVVIMKLLGKIPIQGWTLVIAILTLFLGLIMIMLGIIGEYLWRIFDEIRKRPAFIVDEAIIDEDSTN